MPAAGETSCQALVYYLGACSDPSVTLTMPMIERILAFAINGVD